MAPVQDLVTARLGHQDLVTARLGHWLHSCYGYNCEQSIVEN